ncbi:MAG: acyltransferase [Candidatus Roizmanbacteria bacterium]
MRNPAATLNENQTVLHLFTGLVNTTLTFVFGNYIPMTNGSFWSLVPEILYYVLYPVLVIPLMGYLQRATKAKIILSSLVVWCVLITLTIVFKQLLGFNGLYPFFWFYFYLGNIIAVHQKNILAFCDTYQNKLRSDIWVPAVIFISFLTFPALITTYLKSRDNIIGFILFYPFPALALIYCLRNTYFSRIFQSSLLVSVGTISYSLYLTHTIVIELLRGGEWISPSWTLFQVAGYVLLTMVLTLGLAKLLYELLEKPYFMSRRKLGEMATGSPIIMTNQQAISSKSSAILVAIYIFLIGCGLQKEYSLTSVTHRETNAQYLTRLDTPSVSFLNTQRFVFEIHASDDNFGIFSLPIQHVGSVIKPVLGAEDMTHALRVTVEDPVNHLVISTNEYAGWRFGSESRAYPFGFPQQVTSKDKSYLVIFESLRPTPDDYTVISNPQTELLTVYQMDKSRFLKNPISLVVILWRKLSLIINSREFTLIMLVNILPLFLLLKYLLSNHERNNT